MSPRRDAGPALVFALGVTFAVWLISLGAGRHLRPHAAGLYQTVPTPTPRVTRTAPPTLPPPLTPTATAPRQTQVPVTPTGLPPGLTASPTAPGAPSTPAMLPAPGATATPTSLPGGSTASPQPTSSPVVPVAGPSPAEPALRTATAAPAGGPSLSLTFAPSSTGTFIRTPLPAALGSTGLASLSCLWVLAGLALVVAGVGLLSWARRRR